jgi:hypothetical protein
VGDRRASPRRPLRRPAANACPCGAGDGALSELVGKWESDPTDQAGIAEYGRSTIYFGRDGKMAYVIHEATRDEVVSLTYELDGDELVTDQPVAPSLQRTRFESTRDGRLISVCSVEIRDTSSWRAEGALRAQATAC